MDMPESGVDECDGLVDLYLLVAVRIIKMEDCLDCLLDLLS